MDVNAAKSVELDVSREASVEEAPRERFGLLWGLMSLHEYPDGEQELSMLWGLLDLRTRRGVQPSRAADTYGEAVERASARLEDLREAATVGCLGLGFAFLSLISDAGFWSGIWAIASVTLFAMGGSNLLGAFAENYRGKFLREEIERSRDSANAQRRLAGRHARDMRELTASIAHEIRNPITAAKSLVQQMGEDPGSDDHLEYANVALEELDRVERSVSHLLRFAREESLATSTISLRGVVESALESLAERIDHAGISVHEALDGNGELEGDPEQLRRVVLNLVGNAIDALSESTTANGEIEIALGENLAGDEVWLRVRDNGPGIPDDVLPRIFQPFQTTRQDGTGLGLAITKKAVEAHGGTIEAAAAPAGGAEFVLALPKRPPA